MLYADRVKKRKRIQRGLMFHGFLSAVGRVRFYSEYASKMWEGFEQERDKAG